MNNKSTPNQMRILLGRMRTGNPTYGNITESDGKKKKELTVRDMLKMTRKLNEQTEDVQVSDEEDKKKAVNKETAFDPKVEEDKIVRLFDDSVSVEFKELQIYDNWVFFNFIINGVIQFVFVVTPDEISSRMEVNYLQGFSKDNPKNDEIIEKVKAYYETTFSKYWRNNLIQH